MMMRGVPEHPPGSTTTSRGSGHDRGGGGCEDEGRHVKDNRQLYRSVERESEGEPACLPGFMSDDPPGGSFYDRSR